MMGRDARGSACRRRVASLAAVIARGWSLAREVGLVTAAVTAIRRYVVDFRRFLLYQYPLDSPATRPGAPPSGFDECFIQSNEEADRLLATRCDFRDVVSQARHALDSGAVAFCLYEGREVAHVGWLATSQTARRALDRLGFEVRFGEGEAWLGAVYTVPRYRNRGLLAYSARRRFDRLHHAGFSTCRSAVETNNAASNHVQMHFDPQVYAVGRMCKFFGWRTWSERPYHPGTGRVLSA